MFQLECPSCGELLNISNKYAGTTGKCKSCKASISVPPLAHAREYQKEPSDPDRQQPSIHSENANNTGDKRVKALECQLKRERVLRNLLGVALATVILAGILGLVYINSPDRTGKEPLSEVDDSPAFSTERTFEFIESGTQRMDADHRGSSAQELKERLSDPPERETPQQLSRSQDPAPLTRDDVSATLHSTQRSGVGSLRVYGEVQNNSEETVNWVFVEIVWEDRHGQPVASSSTIAVGGEGLRPEERSQFRDYTTHPQAVRASARVERVEPF